MTEYWVNKFFFFNLRVFFGQLSYSVPSGLEYRYFYTLTLSSPVGASPLAYRWNSFFVYKLSLRIWTSRGQGVGNGTKQTAKLVVNRVNFSYDVRKKENVDNKEQLQKIARRARLQVL